MPARIEKAYHASAGTGKTYRLLHTIFHFQNGKPTRTLHQALQTIDQTLFLSFSNAAVEELKERIYTYLHQCPTKKRKQPPLPVSIKAYTIHSFALEVLRIFRFRTYMALPETFNLHMQEPSIWEEFIWEQVIASPLPIASLLKKHINLFTRYGRDLFFAIKLFGERALTEGNLIQIIDDPHKPSNLDVQTLWETLEHLGNTYIERMFLTSRFDPDVPVFFLLYILRDMHIKEFFQELKNAYNWNIQQVIIDEAQDNDILQNLFLCILIWKDCTTNQEKPRIYLAGDHKQSIYMWRNAFPELYYDILNKLENINKVEYLKTSYRVRNKTTIQEINKITENLAKTLINNAQKQLSTQPITHNNLNQWYSRQKDELLFNNRRTKTQATKRKTKETKTITTTIPWNAKNQKTIIHHLANILKQLAQNNHTTLGILLRTRHLLPTAQRWLQQAIQLIPQHIHIQTLIDMDIPLELTVPTIQPPQKQNQAKKKEKKTQQQEEEFNPFTLLCALAYESHQLSQPHSLSSSPIGTSFYTLLQHASQTNHPLPRLIKQKILQHTNQNPPTEDDVAHAIKTFWKRHLPYFLTGFTRFHLLIQKLNIEQHIETFWNTGRKQATPLPLSSILSTLPTQDNHFLYTQSLNRILNHLIYRAIQIFETTHIHYLYAQPDKHLTPKPFSHYLARTLFLPPLTSHTQHETTPHPSLTLIFSTIHAAKGKEYDAILILQPEIPTDPLNTRKHETPFKQFIQQVLDQHNWAMAVRWLPAQIPTPNVFEHLAGIQWQFLLDASGNLSKLRNYLELFNLSYVAITRTRQHLIWITPLNNTSNNNNQP